MVTWWKDVHIAGLMEKSDWYWHEVAAPLGVCLSLLVIGFLFLAFRRHWGGCETEKGDGALWRMGLICAWAVVPAVVIVAILWPILSAIGVVLLLVWMVDRFFLPRHRCKVSVEAYDKLLEEYEELQRQIGRE